MNSKILVTGCRGQLGTALCRVLTPDYEIAGVDIDNLDITDAEAVARYMDKCRPAVVVNCAAWTAVDAAEANPEACAALNDAAVLTLCRECRRVGARLIHISTDYVFDGTASVPYTEGDEPHPVTVYGRTKLAGERHVLDLMAGDGIVVRTAWLYSTTGNNFVKTMLRLGAERERLSVVVDQVGTPTCAVDLARAIVTIIDGGKWQGGIYHYTDAGVASWYDFAVAIMRLAGLPCRVEPINSDEYPTPAARPHYSVLDKHKIVATYGVEMPHWHESLRQCIAALSHPSPQKP